ncbi:hypothetical protein [Nodularia sp. UHCC 0506]|uniref:hypothetical protein n=1 Tax=Nodularia sp. UHCC 0506 TaxID=3110243 RepID=UPI002B212531|nr:hypothetical protein [Nodularia sp. UHCC 0506]MEA5517180.1 hypothetical protein [Nodularia sp. UHCC 0506]
MNRVFSWLQNTFLRQIIIVFMISFAFFSFQIFNYGNDIAKADTVKTPEGIYYKGTPDDQQIENAQKNLKETAENAREKLNLDEPTPKATKEFLDSVQTQVEDTVQPITGTRHGYYQKNRPETNKR